MIRDKIQEQIQNAVRLPQYVLDKMEHKLTWVGNELKVDDLILYAFVLENNYPKLFFFTETELPVIETKFSFLEYDEFTNLAILQRK